MIQMNSSPGGAAEAEMAISNQRFPTRTRGESTEGTPSSSIFRRHTYFLLVTVYSICTSLIIFDATFTGFYNNTVETDPDVPVDTFLASDRHREDLMGVPMNKASSNQKPNATIASNLTTTKDLKNREVNAPVDIKSKSTAATTLDDLDPTKMCFVTAEFSESVKDADTLPVVPDDMRTTPGRHFVFTNLDDLPVLGWDRIVLQQDGAELALLRRQITKSRWPKFMGWQHAKLQHCQVIFYGDAHGFNPVNETAWMDLGRRIRVSNVGIMQDKQVGRRDKDGPVEELKHAVKINKLSAKAANYTIQWLRNRTDYKTHTRVYKNAIFGYDPANARFQAFVTEFWQEYSKEVGSWRDQPYWSYFLRRHNMRPIRFPFNPPKGERGTQGHNGHVYVKNVASTP